VRCGGRPAYDRRGRALLGDGAFAHRLEDRQSERRHDDVERNEHAEDRRPRAGGGVDEARDGDDERRRTLRGVEEPSVRRGVLGAEQVGAARRKEAVDLARGEERRRSAHDEEGGIVRREDQPQQAERLARERDGHGDLAPNPIGDPPEEDPATAIGQVVDHQRQR